MNTGTHIQTQYKYHLKFFCAVGCLRCCLLFKSTFGLNSWFINVKNLEIITKRVRLVVDLKDEDSILIKIALVIPCNPKVEQIGCFELRQRQEIKEKSFSKNLTLWFCQANCLCREASTLLWANLHDYAPYRNPCVDLLVSFPSIILLQWCSYSILQIFSLYRGQNQLTFPYV